MPSVRSLWYVVDRGGRYNVVSSDDFDEFDSFNIIAKYTTAEAAWDEAERLARLDAEEY